MATKKWSKPASPLSLLQIKFWARWITVVTQLATSYVMLTWKKSPQANCLAAI